MGVHLATLWQCLRLSFIAPYARRRFMQMVLGLCYARMTTIMNEQESRPHFFLKPHPTPLCPTLNFLNPDCVRK